MKIALSVAVPTAPTSVKTLISTEINKVADLILQAPAANAQNVFFGNKAAQPGFIVPGGSTVLEEVSLANTYLLGTAGDNIIVMVTR